MHADFYDRRYYDELGKSNYTGYTFESSPFADHADAIIRMLDHYDLRGPVLDIGCAKGYLVYVLRQRGIEAYGIDWSAYAVDTASPDVRPYLRCASVTEIPFPDKHFALTFSFDVFEHLDEASARLALVECARASTRQLHQINTGRLDEWCYDGDASHCLKLPLRQWRAIAHDLGLATTLICEPDRDLPFLAPVTPSAPMAD